MMPEQKSGRVDWGCSGWAAAVIALFAIGAWSLWSAVVDVSAWVGIGPAWGLLGAVALVIIGFVGYVLVGGLIEGASEERHLALSLAVLELLVGISLFVGGVYVLAANWRQFSEILRTSGAAGLLVPVIGWGLILVGALLVHESNGHFQFSRVRRAAERDPLIASVLTGSMEGVEEALAKQSPDEHMDPDGSTALFYAVRGNQLEIARRLIQAGADVTRWNRQGHTPLTEAIGRIEDVRLELIQTLVEAGAPINQTAKGSTAITAGILGKKEGEDLDLVRWLVAHGGDPSLMGADGVTPLMAAVGIPKPSVISYLLSLGVPLDPVNWTGASVLVTAVYAGRVEIVLELLAAGADPASRSGKGIEVRQIALDRFKETGDPAFNRIADCLGSAGRI